MCALNWREWHGTCTQFSLTSMIFQFVFVFYSSFVFQMLILFSGIFVTVFPLHADWCVPQRRNYYNYCYSYYVSKIWMFYACILVWMLPFCYLQSLCACGSLHFFHRRRRRCRRHRCDCCCCCFVLHHVHHHIIVELNFSFCFRAIIVCAAVVACRL